jgi:uracil-DNA glycosylase
MGKPFVGPAGRRLDIELEQAGIPRHLCWVDNCVRCWIKVRGVDVAPRKAIEECRERHWGQVVERHLANGAWGIAAIGSAASKYLCGEWAGERAAGSLVEVEF